MRWGSAPYVGGLSPIGWGSQPHRLGVSEWVEVRLSPIDLMLRGPDRAQPTDRGAQPPPPPIPRPGSLWGPWDHRGVFFWGGSQPPPPLAHRRPPARPFGDPADLGAAHGAADPIAAVLLLHHDAARGAQHGLTALHQGLRGGGGGKGISRGGTRKRMGGGI